MKNFKESLTSLGLLFLLLTQSDQLFAQVTIGSASQPNRGALLDLKEDDKIGTNSKRGLGLPKVALKSNNTIEMGSLTIGNDKYKEHIGLLLWNATTKDGSSISPITTRDEMLCPGIHVWNGSKWQPLVPYLGTGLFCDGSGSGGSITIDNNKMQYIFTSGQDRRLSPTEQTVKLRWRPTTATVDMVETAVGTFPKLVYSSPLPSQIASGGLANYSLTPNAMTKEEVEANAFTTRKQELTFTVIDEIGDSHDVTIELVQTNYAIQVDGNLTNYEIALNVKETYSLPVLSNVTWKADVVNPTINIIENVSGTSGGAIEENAPGGPATSFTFDPITTAGGLRSVATVKFTDNSTINAAKDITVSLISCLGTEDFSGLEKATVGETNNPASNWGTKVILHDEKPGVYGAFVSAHFGEAGRWMTTNLTAWDYDGVSHSQGKNLVQHDGSQSTHNTPSWTYPGLRGGSNPEKITATEVGKGPTEGYSDNPFIGLLFSWDAATAGKGGADGLQNIYSANPDPSAKFYNESSMEEWVGAGNNPPNGKQKRIQGICPKGWHLPSDYEWTELEREITMNTSKYTSMEGQLHKTPETDTDPSDNEDEKLVVRIPLPGDPQPGLRGRHAPAMASPCPPLNAPIIAEEGRHVAMGISNAVKDGGFEVGMSGHAIHSDVKGYGSMSYLWTSSTNIITSPGTGIANPSIRVINRQFIPNVPTLLDKVGAIAYPSNHMIAVRCKQDK